MKKLSLLLTITGAIAQTVLAQGLNIGSGVSFKVVGSPYVVLQNAGLVSSGTITPGTGSFVFRGNAATVNISASGSQSFYDLSVDKSAGSLTLADNISVTHAVNMVNGMINLNGNDLNIGSAANITGESTSSYITGTTGGRILTTRTLNAPASVNAGNLGVEITSAANLGQTQIIRSHVQQTGSVSGLGINRYYEIIPAAINGLNATIGFHYFDHELAGINESELTLAFKPNASQPWRLIGNASLNTTTNIVSRSGIDSFGRFTLSSNLNNPLFINTADLKADIVHGRAILRWEASKINITRFDIELSTDGRYYTTRASTTPDAVKAGDGFEFTDARPFSGISYYRIKILQPGQAFFYSNSVRIDNNTPWIEAAILPNPTSDILRLQYRAQKEEEQHLLITDETGKVLLGKRWQTLPGINQLSWNIDLLPSGYYILHMNNEYLKFLKR